VRATNHICLHHLCSCSSQRDRGKGERRGREGGEERIRRVIREREGRREETGKRGERGNRDEGGRGREVGDGGREENREKVRERRERE
jgi:hypothetical protein